jgi:hypothetical protein
MPAGGVKKNILPQSRKSRRRKKGGDLESMMKRGKAKRTKGDTINNENNYRHQLSPLP